MDERFHIDLDVHVCDGEVEGRVGDRQFSGWIELLAALDALIEPDSGGEPGAQPCG
jgi:hypothetical protein